MRGDGHGSSDLFFSVALSIALAPSDLNGRDVTIEPRARLVRYLPSPLEG
jgi:hypothetical protein